MYANSSYRPKLGSGIDNSDRRRNSDHPADRLCRAVRTDHGQVVLLRLVRDFLN